MTISISIRMDSNHIKPLEHFSAELAFVDPEQFLKTKNNKIIQQIIDNDTNVCSIHSPHFKILDPKLDKILYKLRSLMRELKVKNIVIHPSFGSLKNKSVLDSIGKIKSILRDFNVYIETFGSKRRWASSWEEFGWLNRYYGFRVCWDFSHCKERLNDLDYYLPIVDIMHVSNIVEIGKSFKQHQRLFDSDGVISYTGLIKKLKKWGWSGELCLEYLEEYHPYLIEDAQRLEELVYD